MPDGPPWIRNVYKDSLPEGWLGGPDRPRGEVFHLELDENHLYTVKADFTRPAGNVNELDVSFYKPVFGNRAERFLFINDHYPEHRGPFHGYKFDNEDIYVGAEYKDKYNPSLSVTWALCSAVGSAVSPPRVNSQCVMDFSNQAGSKIRVTITFER